MIFFQYLTALCFAFGLTVTGSVYGFVYRTEVGEHIPKYFVLKDMKRGSFVAETE